MFIKIAKICGLLAAGALSGILATMGRSKRSDGLLVRVWATEPFKSNVIGEALVRKNGARWMSQDGSGFTVDEIRPK